MDKQTEHDEKKRKQVNAYRAGLICIISSMVLMALWGWTPLKQIIPGVLVILAVGFTLLSLIRGVQVRSLKAAIDDQ
jgi:MFS superfamily sulfate permease-like transporter